MTEYYSTFTEVSSWTRFRQLREVEYDFENVFDLSLAKLLHVQGSIDRVRK